MSINYHKIRGVEKSVCTQEQKIAYNIAFVIHINHGSEWEKRENYCRSAQVEFLHELIHMYCKDFQRNYPNCKADIDGIFSALNAGLENYLNKFFIAWDYESIGKAFPAHYLEEARKYE